MRHRASTTTAVTTDVWLTQQQAAAYAAFHVVTLQRAIKRGDLRAARVGGKSRVLRLRKSWVDAWLQAGDVGTAPR